ncbi:hypothetical protein PV10_09082 [Exophiala mesophila]|uniref:Rhamnolipids biosynthesis 3-oxoacyl-[acyl-carrier-protein] reductase n=2 Tax=Exophiala mesophila TaxID=212818 RepID=A0A0D1ZN02_EXOME|nr:uncharacterized protein PV10_09082 [Exophiala mesophila]KIV88158.1 hypothetical protein PV10_09082 [Exophiala mesophila]
MPSHLLHGRGRELNKPKAPSPSSAPSTAVSVHVDRDGSVVVVIPSVEPESATPLSSFSHRFLDLQMAAIKDFNNLFRLDGKIAVVTGASRGIGLYTSAALLQAGCELVIITARDETNLNNAATQLNAIPNIAGKALAMPANVGHTDQIEKFVRDVQQVVGSKGVDILVANAASSWGGPFEPFEDWKSQKTLDLNVRGVFNLVRFMVPLLQTNATVSSPSRILLTSSVGGIIVPHVGERGAIMYSVSKAAVHHLGRNLALELAPKNITTNIVAPGFFPSRLANPQINFLGGEDVVGKQNPLGRLGQPADIAGVIVYLCSPAGAYINGVDISLDGGARLRVGTHPEGSKL